MTRFLSGSTERSMAIDSGQSDARDVAPALLRVLLVSLLFVCVGAPPASARAQWNTDMWTNFHDTFHADDAQTQTARMRIIDADGIASASLHATNDGGTTWDEYPMTREEPGSDWWVAAAPVSQVQPGVEIHYYYSCVDSTGEADLCPEDAPAETFEFSVLPINGSIGNPCMLLVDKHGRSSPGGDEMYSHLYEYYIREAMDVLGYTYDLYHVWVSNSPTYHGDGPDTSGMKYYDTQVWFFGYIWDYSLKRSDQVQLIDWLAMAGEGKERNLVITGNGVGMFIDFEGDTLDFYSGWMATEFLGRVGPGQLTVRDAAGGHDFMTYDDGQCPLHSGFDYQYQYDKLGPVAGTVGAELAVQYGSSAAAGVAYTHPTLGYQAVNLGFGVMFMMESVLPGGVLHGGHPGPSRSHGEHHALLPEACRQTGHVGS